MSLAYWWIAPIAVALVVAVIALGVLARRRRSGTPIANSSRLTQLPAYRRALARANWSLILAGTVLAATVIAATLAGSRWVYTKVVTPEKFNRDIVLCLDVSGSMVDYDAKVIDRYLEMLPGFDGERMALVVWNSSAVPVFPLTDDYAFVERQLIEMRDAMTSGGLTPHVEAGTLENDGASLVGDGLASCVMQFEGASPSDTSEPELDGRSRSIIIATDNVVNGTQTITLPEAAAYADRHEIRVYGLDANEHEDGYADEYRRTIEKYGGGYFQLTDGTHVDTIVDTITSEQTSLVRGAPQLYVIDRPEVWLWALLILGGGYLVVVWRMRL